jgi:hypothetical protein
MTYYLLKLKMFLGWSNCGQKVALEQVFPSVSFCWGSILIYHLEDGQPDSWWPRFGDLDSPHQHEQQYYYCYYYYYCSQEKLWKQWTGCICIKLIQKTAFHSSNQLISNLAASWKCLFLCISLNKTFVCVKAEFETHSSEQNSHSLCMSYCSVT